MSEVSMLSAQFRNLSKAVDRVNHAVIVFKAQYVNNEPRCEGEELLALEQGELEDAACFMNEFIDNVASLNNPDKQNAQNLPNAIAVQLQSTVIAEIPDFFMQIRGIKAAIV